MTRMAIAIALVLSSMVGASCVGAWAQDAGASNSIKLVVLGLHSNEGEVDCALFGSAEGFLGDYRKAIKTTKSKIENGQGVCTFSGIAPGGYAVSVFHDENGNGKLDRNFWECPMKRLAHRMTRRDSLDRRNLTMRDSVTRASRRV